MEKILLAIDPSQFNPNTVDFACYIAKITGSKLTALFLEDGGRQTVAALASIPGLPFLNTTFTNSSQPAATAKVREANVQLFEDLCRNRGVNFSIHCDQDVPLGEMITESRFADMLIIDSQAFFDNGFEQHPTNFVRNVLRASECPVIVAPRNFTEIDEILFAYDGTPSSVFAIKQFNYLFPNLSDKKISVVQVHDDNEVPLVEKVRISELLRAHYSRIGFGVLHGKPADKLFGHLNGKKNIFVVIGAFGRNAVSELITPSTAGHLIKGINLPLFIAHH